ncbi:MAG: DNA-processing protein DprA [candidate division Zixibacteria bacterium]|nr:DNA-processing protein DprA [candidate division Zixibacteria bacterium]
MDYRKYVVALREKAKVGPKGFQQLLMSFGSPENVYKASKEELLSLPRMNPEKAEQILKSQDLLPEIEEHLLYLEEQGIGVLTILDDDYPQQLKQIDDPPPLLYFKGEFPIQSIQSVAVVGTHNATAEGIETAVQIGKELAQREVVVVSGLAKGIDAAAHVGAISQGGKTYAVLGSGLNKIYPSDNVTLAKEISQNGALITEYNLDVPVKVGQLMARNRIVVGLSQAVIVVEVNEKSEGTMDAVDLASKQGKPLFVMKKEGSQKVEELISEGAVSLQGVDDLDLVVNYL